MLSDEVLEKVIDRLIVRINQGNEYILKKMGESAKRIGTLTQTQAQQLSQIFKYGGDYEKIVQELAKLTNMNVADIYKIFEEVAKNDWQFAQQFYKYRGIKYIPFDKNNVLKKQVNAIAKMTAEEYLNLARTSVMGYAIKNSKGQLVFRNIKQVYHELIDEAILNVSQGKETFDEVMYRKLKEIGESGLKVVYPTTYIGKDGKEHHYIRRLDSAIRMNLKDGLRTLHNETQQQFGKEFKSDGVEISVHLNPAPDHEKVQGHQFSNEEFEKFQTDQDSTSYDGTFYPAESEETGHDRRSIGQYSCYHYVFSIVLGISKPEYTNEQLQQIIDKNNEGFDFEGKHYSNYEGTQLQRKIELEIRKAKDNQVLGRNSGNEQLIGESQDRIRLLNSKYKKLNRASGLPSFIDRARVSGYRRISEKKIDRTKIGKDLYDVTEQELKNATPNSHEVVRDDYFIDDSGIKHPIKGKENVHITPEDSVEYKRSLWLEETFGGEIHNVPRITDASDGSFKVKTQDFIWKNEKWELKTPKPLDKKSNVIEAILKKKRNKIQSNNFIVDIKNTELTKEEIYNFSIETFNKRQKLKKLMIVKEEKLLFIIFRQ